MNLNFNNFFLYLNNVINPMIKRSCLFISIFLITCSIYGQSPVLLSKNISECQTNCPTDEKAKIIESESTLKLRIEKFINCSVNNESEFSFEFKNDTLNLNFEYMIVIIDTIYHELKDTILETIKINDSTYREIRETSQDFTINESKGMTFCLCYFIVDLTFSNYPFVPKTILVNRKRVIIDGSK
jgi:hypothetical protein